MAVSDMPSDDEIAEDEDGPKIEASAEMEEVLREATEALEAREQASATPGGEGDPNAQSTDKLTIEMLSRELQDLKSLHEEKLKEGEALSDRYLRLQAEFENFRRRGLKEKQESFKFGHQNLVKDLLSAVDNLERALEHGAQNAGTEAKGILDGVELVHRELLAAFAKHGVQEIEAQGQTFDPAVHEAMGQVPSPDLPPNSVLEVLQKGYVIHDRMLRPARVIVTREADANAPAAGGQDADEGSA